ncbi:hypothetical protein [uncultured Kriegella sp.]|uniref:hypothetical protein n=1 Tax=uncultured Kriegella sp. TaxID=1798910 RepID=UPI0030DC2995|tara:strand:+ start:130084 stop:130458 length:375 start_codon:yes stop_codon:yes gene_type:complete
METTQQLTQERRRAVYNRPTDAFQVKDQSALVLRLERNEQYVRQLREKLNSYVCEPNTYSLFERIQALKTGLDTFSSTNREIIAAIRDHRKTVEDYVDKIKHQFSEFNELRKNVDDYVEVASSY